MPAKDNPGSWRALISLIAEYPDDDRWGSWKATASEFLQRGMDAGLDVRFRAGQSMHWFLFSTLDHHGLSGWDPHVTVFIRSREDVEISYGVEMVSMGRRPEVSYSLPFEEAFATFRRFLTHLWTATVPEPVPPDLRAAEAGFSAPVLRGAVGGPLERPGQLRGAGVQGAGVPLSPDVP